MNTEFDWKNLKTMGLITPEEESLWIGHFKEQRAAQPARPDGAEIEKFYKEAQRGKFGPIGGKKFKEMESRLLKPLVSPRV